MEAICPNCGAHYYGWALINPIAQKCDKCGSTLKVKNEYLPAKSCSDRVMSNKVHS